MILVSPVPRANEVAAINNLFSALVNFGDEQFYTFNDAITVPRFWFPIDECAPWGYNSFFGALKVYLHFRRTTRKPVIFHCFAGVNRSACHAYAVYKALGIETPKEMYPVTWERNIQKRYIPSDIIDFLKVCIDNPNLSLMSVRNKMNHYSSLADVYGA